MPTTPAILLGLLFHSLTVGGEMGSSTREMTIETPLGEVVAETGFIEPVPQEIVGVSASQAAEFDALAAQSGDFLDHYVSDNTGVSLEQLDEAFRLWQQEEGDRYTEQQVVEMLGAYLGRRLIQDFDMEWVFVKDEYGTDYAVRAKRSGILSFPFSSVAKRIEDQQYGFMAGVYYTLKHVVESGEYEDRDAEDGS